MKMSGRPSQNIGLKNKWCITQSNKKIKRLNKDLMKKKSMRVEVKNEDNKFLVKENSSPSPIKENFNEFKLKKRKKRRNMYEPTKTPKYILEQEPMTSGEDINISTNSSKKATTQDKKPIRIKKKMFDSFGEEYKPGMLSDSIQRKKYGRVIIPWDPSFGLDKTYKVPDIKKEGLPKLKINSLFDLSKRQDTSSKLSVDKNQHSIFVGNLPSDIRVYEIKKLFKKCGMIHHIKIKDRNKNGKSSSKTYNEDQRHKHALITFKQEESCNKALKMNGHIYKDCHLRVNKASDSTKHEGSEKTIFVGNLAFVAEDEDLWKAFGSCGEIQEVRIIKDERSGKGKGYGYITFKEEEAVKKALELDGLNILKRDIRVRQNVTGTPTYPKKFDKRKKGNFELCDSIGYSDRNDDEKKKINENIPSKSEDKKEHKRKKRQRHSKKLINLEANESIQIPVKEEKINKTEKEDNFSRKVKKIPSHKKRRVS